MSERADGLTHMNAEGRATMVDVTLRRIVRKNVFRLAKMTGNSTSGSFRKTRPGDGVVD